MKLPAAHKETIRALRDGSGPHALADSSLRLIASMSHAAEMLAPLPSGAVNLQLTPTIKVPVMPLTGAVASDLKRDGNAFFVAGEHPTEKDLAEFLWRLSPSFTRTPRPSLFGRVAAARASTHELVNRVWRNPRKRAAGLRSVVAFIEDSRAN